MEGYARVAGAVGSRNSGDACLKMKCATDATIDWGQCITMAHVMVADLGHGRIVSMDDLHRWGATVDIATGEVQLDTNAAVDMAMDEAQLGTNGPEVGAPGEVGAGPEVGTGRLWTVAAMTILGRTCVAVPIV